MQFSLPVLLACAAMAQSISLPFIGSSFTPQTTIGGDTYGQLWTPECRSKVRYDGATIIYDYEEYTRIVKADLYSNPCHTIRSTFQYTKYKELAYTQISVTLQTVKAKNAPDVCFSDALPSKNMTGALDVFVFGEEEGYKQVFPFLLEAGNDQTALKFETKLKYDDILNYFEFGANICLFDPTSLALKSQNIAVSSTVAIDHLKENSYYVSVVNAFNEFSVTGKVQQHKPKDWNQLFQAAVEHKADVLQGIALSGLLSHNIEKNLHISGWKNIISESCDWGIFIKHINSALPCKYTISAVPKDDIY